MNELAGLSSAIWGICVATECFLLGSLLFRGKHRDFPFFSSYIFASLLQSAALFVTYRIWGFTSYEAWVVAWATQAILMTGRALAVAEITHRLFQRHRGIWELIRRVLLVSAAVVLLYGVIVARHNWLLIMPNIQRGLDLAIVTALVGLFLFVRYYQLLPPAVLTSLALGFLLYCSFAVLNGTVLEHSRETYWPLWTLLQMISFLASVVIWIGAFWQPQEVRAHAPILPSSELYKALTPEVNLKLRHLNEQLSRFWKIEDNEP